MPKVVIADDEEYVRIFMRTMLETIQYQVVAEVETGGKLFDTMLEHKPDILFLDLNMPELTGIDYLETFSKSFPKTCTIILTSAALFDLIGQPALKDARCFLRKDTPVEEMIKIIDRTWNDFKKELGL